MSKINMLFPEAIYTEKLDLDEEYLNQHYDKQSWLTYRGTKRTGVFTEVSKNFELLKEMPEIESAILTSLKKYTSNVLKYKNNFKVTTSWFTKTEKNQFSIMHNHANSMFSAVYYFGNNVNSEIKFEKKSMSMWEIKPIEHNEFNCGTDSMIIENGTIIIFPSYLPHQVVEHKDNGVRKSLAVNFIPVGEIGSGNGSMSIT